MRIVCPGCDATYEVPASRLKPGKLVRCARCGSDWVPEVEAEGAPAEQAIDQQDVSAELPEITAMDRLAAAPAPPPPSRAKLIAAWALTAAVLTGAVAATLGWRDAVVRAWPPSGRILAASPAPVSARPVQTAGKKPE